MEYNHNEHKHRFAVWTASRAVQRSWVTTLKISQVVQSVQLRDFVENYTNLAEQNEFDELHRNWCVKMIDHFSLANIAASYGRVSKIIAVYFKTSIIISANSDESKIRLIHPPIDRIILKNLPSNVPEFKAIKKLNWTQLDQKDYWLMVETIRNKLGFFDWRLETLWNPELQ
jgi:hypothetical protein